MLLVQVAVGNAETVVRRDAARGAPSSGFDSIVVPGRQLPSQLHDAREKKPGWNGPKGRQTADKDRSKRAQVNEEYVIFDGSQARPLYLLTYEM